MKYRRNLVSAISVFTLFFCDTSFADCLPDYEGPCNDTPGYGDNSHDYQGAAVIVIAAGAVVIWQILKSDDKSPPNNNSLFVETIPAQKYKWALAPISGSVSEGISLSLSYEF